jgi:Spy/CpxP family protein refolding chaperone
VKRALLLGLLVVSLSVNAVVAFHAVRRHAPGIMAGLPFEPPLFRVLSLTEVQKGAIVARRQQLMAQRELTSARLGELRGRLADALAQGEAGRPRIDGVLAEMEAAQRDYQRAVVEHLLAVRETLTPDQRPVFGRMLGERLREGWMIQPGGMAPPMRGGGGT